MAVSCVLAGEHSAGRGRDNCYLDAVGNLRDLQGPARARLGSIR